MKRPHFFLLASSLFLAASAAAAVPHRWTVETTRVQPEQIEAYCDMMFIGWFETSDFSGPAVTQIPSTATGTKTFYAKWA